MKNLSGFVQHFSCDVLIDLEFMALLIVLLEVK